MSISGNFPLNITFRAPICHVFAYGNFQNSSAERMQKDLRALSVSWKLEICGWKPDIVEGSRNILPGMSCNAAIYLASQKYCFSDRRTGNKKRKSWFGGNLICTVKNVLCYSYFISFEAKNFLYTKRRKIENRYIQNHIFYV